MKKVLSVVTALLVALTMLSAGALATPEPGDVLGIWYLTSIVYGDTAMNPADFGMEITLELNEDGTANMGTVGDDDVETGTWVIAGDQIIISTDGEDIEFTLEDGNLIAEQDEGLMIFGRERPEFETYEIVPIRTDAALADFNGNWIAFLAANEEEGLKFPAAALGFDVSLAIEDGMVTVAAFGGSQLFEGNVSDGVLTAVEADTGGDGETMTFNLHEDGVVSANFMETITLYFEKVE